MLAWTKPLLTLVTNFTLGHVSAAACITDVIDDLIKIWFTTDT